MPISMVILAANFTLIGLDISISEIFWLLGSILVVIFSILTPFIMFKGEHVKLEHISPAWFIPPVALIITPTIGSSYITHFSGLVWEFSIFLNYFGCGAGRFYMAMRANGDLQPCVFFPLKVGNILEDDFEELWKHNKVLQELRDKDILHGCNTCEYRYYCGGCRARAYAYTGDYLAPDPGCINNKEKVYEKIVETWS